MTQQSHYWAYTLRKPRFKKTHLSPVFTATVLTVARVWKQPKCPSTDECIKKLWYMYTMEYYSAIQRTAFESVLMRWTKLEPVIQSEGVRKRNINIIY